MSHTLFVTGASGNLGRLVLDFLLEKHAGTIIAGTRTPEKLADYANRGVMVRHADFDQPESLAQAFAGVDRLLLISTDAVGVPGLRIQQHINAVRAADAAGVKHVVYTSLMNPVGSPVLLAPDHEATEQALAASRMGYTILRENLYTETLLGSLAQAVQMGKLFNAIGDGKAAFITREDCARAAAAALMSDYEGRRTLDITGPDALSPSELVSIASEITGQTIEYVPLPADVMTQNLVNVGLPEPIAALIVSFDMAVAQGLMANVSSAVEDLTGQKPTSAADFLANKLTS